MAYRVPPNETVVTSTALASGVIFYYIGATNGGSTRLFSPGGVDATNSANTLSAIVDADNLNILPNLFLSLIGNDNTLTGSRVDFKLIVIGKLEHTINFIDILHIHVQILNVFRHCEMEIMHLHCTNGAYTPFFINYFMLMLVLYGLYPVHVQYHNYNYYSCVIVYISISSLHYRTTSSIRTSIRQFYRIPSLHRREHKLHLHCNWYWHHTAMVSQHRETECHLQHTDTGHTNGGQCRSVSVLLGR